MLIDFHAHSSGISHCCQIPYDQVLQHALDNGMDGIVLTNHYQKSYVKDGCLDEFVDKYIAEFLAAHKYGERIGCRVYFGIELTMELYNKVHMLIYGVGTEFLQEHPQLFDLTHEQLYELVKAHNGVLVQAHPFRNGTKVLDTRFLDGIEINCHPLYKKSYADEILRIAEENDLIVTCGGDYHADTYRPKCGMYLPDDVKSHNDIRSYLLGDGEKQLCMQEPYNDSYAIICIE